ncbi:MAG: acn, partial [Phycisphaerales bacterium]|nr:acn [Phycisphaerales bacterium]
GIRAVVAKSFERIHRSNLVGMGVLPLVFKKGEGRKSLGLTGQEVFEILIDDDLKVGQDIAVRAGDKMFVTTCRIDTPVELEYFKNGGIMPTVLRKMMAMKS